MWVLEVGGEAEQTEQTQEGRPQERPRADEETANLPDLDPRQGEEAKAADGAAGGPPQRLWSVFGRGWHVLRNALAVGLLVLGSWHPEPWPDHPIQGLPATPAACTAKTTEAPSRATDQPATACSTPVVHEYDSS